MATEHQTLDTTKSNFDDSSQLPVRRGEHILRMLQHAARVARLETQVIELQAALNQAHLGDPSVLEQWLLDYDQQPTTTPAVSLFGATELGRRSDHRSSAAGDQANGWSAYLPHARSRLNAIRLQLGDMPPWLTLEPAGVTAESATVAVLGGHADEQLDDCIGHEDGMDRHLTNHVATNHVDVHVSDRSHGRVENRVDMQPASPVVDGIEDQADSMSLPGSLSGDLTSVGAFGEGELSEGDPSSLMDLAELIDLHIAPSVAVALSSPQPLGKRVFGSYGFSILGHALVLVALGTMTYRVPSEGNSLGGQVLEAAEAASDSELTTEIEMLEPAQLQVSEPLSDAVQPSTSMASELAQLSQSVSAATVEIPIASDVGSTIASSISAASDKSSNGSRGTGAPSMSGNFFGVGTGGNYFCYVVDRSGSMRGGAWESAKAELMRSLKSLKATQRFYIVFFADEFEALPEPGSDRPAASGLYATPENVEHARNWIQSVQLNRGGPPNEALAWAIEREPDAIYLLTDGVTKVDVCGFLRKSNRIEDIVSGAQVRVPIHAIAYFSLDGQQLMRQLAKENQGQFIYVPKPKTKK